MKRILFFCILLVSISAAAQNEWYHYAEEFYFVKEMPVKAIRGKNFRYEIAVKELPGDTLSKVRIHGIAVGKGQDDFISSDFKTEVRKEQEWTVYTIIGTVSDHAWKIWFYSAVNGNGSFYFDDISFYVEDQPGQWKQLRLFNTSFEEKGNDIFSGYYVSKRKSTKLKTQISNSVYKTGTHSLLVSTNGNIPTRSANAGR